MMKSVDTRLFKRRYSDMAYDNHIAQLDETRNLLHIDNPKVVTVPLTEMEQDYWGSDVPAQQCTEGDFKVVWLPICSLNRRSLRGVSRPPLKAGASRQ
jgi:hypothetical protein